MSEVVLQSFEYAQKKSIELLKEIFSSIQSNMQESDIRTIIREQALKSGASGWFRKPFVRLFPKGRAVHPESLIQIHLQPIYGDAFGSIGVTKCFARADTDIVLLARELCLATLTFGNRWKCTGELFVFAHSWCTNHRVTLEHEKNVGHQCFSKGQSPALWPYSARAYSMLRRYQIQWFNPRRLQGIFAVHPFIQRHDQFAGFAELFYIKDEEKILLGRSDLSQVGTL